VKVGEAFPRGLEPLTFGSGGCQITLDSTSQNHWKTDVFQGVFARPLRIRRFCECGYSRGYDSTGEIKSRFRSARTQLADTTLSIGRPRAAQMSALHRARNSGTSRTNFLCNPICAVDSTIRSGYSVELREDVTASGPVRASSPTGGGSMKRTLSWRSLEVPIGDDDCLDDRRQAPQLGALLSSLD